MHIALWTSVFTRRFCCGVHVRNYTDTLNQSKARSATDKAAMNVHQANPTHNHER